MILWCKVCCALMGLREPLDDWSTDPNGICPACADPQLLAMPKVIPEDSTKPEDPLPGSST
jgi:hypothetical protein